MIHPRPHPPDLTIHPLTRDRWDDLVALFGKAGAVGGCWCMWWRLDAATYRRNAGEGNRRALRALVDGGAPVGLLAYAGSRPVGWCSVAPATQFAARRSNRSPVFRPVDDRPLWNVLCFFVAPDYRGTGVADALLGAAVEHARAHGAPGLEGIPVDPGQGHADSARAYPGLVGMFRRWGFEEVANRRGRPVMRLLFER
jgi:GNAT superfamily N-acetyltransferase